MRPLLLLRMSRLGDGLETMFRLQVRKSARKVGSQRDWHRRDPDRPLPDQDRWVDRRAARRASGWRRVDEVDRDRLENDRD